MQEHTSLQSIYCHHAALSCLSIPQRHSSFAPCSNGWVSLSCTILRHFLITDHLLQVHKILGPGNQFVTAAKMTLQNSEAMVAMDMPAGPSEVLVIADASASPAHIAADLLSQAEHGPDSQVEPGLMKLFEI